MGLEVCLDDDELSGWGGMGCWEGVGGFVDGEGAYRGIRRVYAFDVSGGNMVMTSCQ